MADDDKSPIKRGPESPGAAAAPQRNDVEQISTLLSPLVAKLQISPSKSEDDQSAEAAVASSSSEDAADVYSRPTRDEFDNISPVFKNFIAEYLDEIETSKSFVVTPMKINGEMVIYVGALNHHELELPSKYGDYEVYIREDKVVSIMDTTPKSELRSESPSVTPKPSTSKELGVGDEIGPVNAPQRHKFGTLGGFFELETLPKQEKIL